MLIEGEPEGRGWDNFSDLIGDIKGEQLEIHCCSHSSFCERKHSSSRYLAAVKWSYTDDTIESNLFIIISTCCIHIHTEHDVLM